MANPEKKAGDSAGTFPLLNQLITSMEDAETKLEAAYYKNNRELVNSLKASILDIQKQIAKEVK